MISCETTIFLEGPSCSGKSTILSRIDLPGVRVVLKDWPANVTAPGLRFFLERDEDKLARAKLGDERVKLVDRGYLSTLVANSVLEEQRCVSAGQVYAWYQQEMGHKLYQPDCYVFIYIPPEITLQRARDAQRTIHDDNMWLKFPERIQYWYEKLFTELEEGVPVYRFDGTKPKGEVLGEFRELIKMYIQE